MITLIANAKINLFLDITGKRPNGYHNLETVMQSVDLSDVVTVELSDGITVDCSNPEIPRNEGNICYKAAELFYSELGKPGGAEIRIEKRIPHGAGLGGGSADAAAVLTGLNALCGEPLSDADLTRLGVKIGADVPFCLTGGQKFCGGIGDEIAESSEFTWSNFLIVKPNFPIDTKSAYAEYDRNPVKRCGERVYNVFRAVYANPELDVITEKLKSLGAEASELSGSGSAVFGAFSDEDSARSAAREFPKYFTAVCKAASKGIIIIENG